MDKKEKDFQGKLLSIFKVEAAEHIQVLSSGLVELERSRTAEKRLKIIETIFREAHSLKGAARAVGLSGIESMCQAAESVLAALKRQEIHLSPTLFDVLHDAVDAIGKSLPSDENKSISHEKFPVRDLLHRLETALKGNEALPEKPDAKSDEKAEAAPQDQAQQAFLPTPLEENSVFASTVRIATAKLDAVLFQVEELLSAKLAAFQRVAEIREAVGELATLKKEQARIAPVQKAFQQAWDKAGKRNGFDKAEPQLRKLLEFMALEATVLKSFEARLAALAKSAEHDQRSLGTMVDGLLEDMKKVLMLPISSALEMFPKMVRDLSRDKGKEAKLVVAGGEIEIDRRILEEVRDPLVHLIRNCIDHGIETPEVRQHENKPPQGTVTLAMKQKNGNKIEILVSDDGAGIDLSKVREAARKLGLVLPEDADSPAVLPLVFQSGVSTAPIITDLSGRGLGLAIVREKVERLGGIVLVETDPGNGTTFRMVLPLTLATFRGVHVRVNGQQFVLPSTHVEQGVRLKKEVIKTVENRETIPWKDEAVALVRLADVLELLRVRVDGAANDTVQVVILGAASQRIAFGVDEILSEQEVLVKPLGKQLSRVRNIAGATVLGTGKSVPILNVADLLRSAVKVVAAPVATQVDKQEAVVETKSIVVVEDSITSRALLQSILESAGYKVVTAVDGIDALTRLKTERFDLVVSDVEMPRMDGFDLTLKIRADKALAPLPVILVTALESREHRERGVDAGANAYIVKSSFDQSNLLEIVRRLI